MTNGDGEAFSPLGLDLDGTIDEAPAFFSWLSRSWPGRVVVITYRPDRDEAARDLRELGVRWDELVLVDSFEQKADEIAERGIGVYFDDMDEMLRHVDERVAVFKVRNGGNFDFEQARWLYSRHTGRLV